MYSITDVAQCFSFSNFTIMCIKNAQKDIQYNIIKQSVW